MAGASAAIEFRVLGGVEARRNGTPVKLGGPRQRALLALLLVAEGKAVPADRLIEELWHGEPPAGAAGTLQSYVSRLRSALAADGAIVGTASAYTLDVDDESVDAQRFERLVDEGHAALERGAARRAVERFDTALALWGGTPFSGVDGEGALRAEADRLAEVHLRAREGRTAAKLQLGGGEELVDELESLVSENPYRERLWGHLMLALYRAGRQADALAAYRRAREVLDRELGLEPSNELKQLEGTILRQEVPPAQPPEERTNLPAPLTSFVGRQTELAEIERLFSQTRLLSLTGVGGVGKTRVALETARRALPDFPDGAYFVDFSALSAPKLVPRRVAAALEVHEQGDSEIVDLLVARVREAEILLVLDNCEHVRDACAELAQRLLSGAPKLRVLATSREVLGVAGEVDCQIPPLQPAEAVDLFLARARAARPGLTDDERALASIARICEVLDGLPLALELAAVRTKALSLEEIASRLSDRFRFLVSWRRLATARHRTLRETMDWSYDLLAAEEQDVLARLSVFAGGFTLAAVAAVCLDEDEDRAIELLERLVDASLVTTEEQHGNMRYGLLETVRQYAAGRLRERPDHEEDAIHAHGRFFADLVKYGDHRSGDEAQGHLIDDDLDNFRVAIDNAVRRGDFDTELSLVGGLWRYWWVRGLLWEGRTRIDAAVERWPGEIGGTFLARALAGGGWLAMSQGEYDRARVLATRGLHVARSCGGFVQEIAALNTLGVVAMRCAEYDVARRHLQEEYDVAAHHGSGEVDVAKMNLGLVELLAGNSESAAQIFEELRELHGRNGRLHLGYGFAAINLGRAMYRLDDLERGEAAFDEARAAFAAIGFRAHYAHALQGLAAIAARRGNAQHGVRILGEAAAVLGQVDASEDDFEPGLIPTVEASLRSQLGEDTFAALYEQAQREANGQA
jgi:predicted ATPase/DNA-binding SARP family transcriptional activator